MDEEQELQAVCFIRDAQDSGLPLSSAFNAIASEQPGASLDSVLDLFDGCMGIEVTYRSVPLNE